MIEELNGKRFVICVKNDGYPASLELWKVYQSIPDSQFEKHGEIRVIDEEGEDYLYPKDYFSPVQIEQVVAERLLQKSIHE